MATAKKTLAVAEESLPEFKIMNDAWEKLDAVEKARDTARKAARND
jgi:hypothetical protein